LSVCFCQTFLAWSEILGQGLYWQLSAKAGISYGKRLSSLPATPGTKKK
jgi:hypothetical protein